jgi:hypothetical protein
VFVRWAVAGVCAAVAMLGTVSAGAAEGAPSAGRTDSSAGDCAACPGIQAEIRVSTRAKGRWRPGFAMRALSLRGSVERTRVGNDDQTAGSLGVEERALAYLSLGNLSARYSDFFALGGGDAGVDGGVGVDAALGYRAPLGERHGPLARVGVRAHWLYYGHFYTSLLELPQAQLGYSYVSRGAHVEAAARAGPVLTGRYGVDGGAATRLGGSLEVGGYAALAVRPLRLDIEVARVRLDGGERGPVDSLDALLCGALGHPTVCLRTGVMRGRLVARSALEEAKAFYVGVTIGVGPVEWR